MKLRNLIILFIIILSLNVFGAKANTKSFKPLVLKDTSKLSTKMKGWSWKYSPKEEASLLSKYHAYADGDTTKKVIYLTFDEGYENGYTMPILDVLKKNNVKAAFFVTAPYVTANFKGTPDIDILKRMVKDGHLICNHSVHHKSMPIFTNESQFNNELTELEKKVNNIPGLKMSKYFRPPKGEYSELSLYYTQRLGYKSIFYSLAYKDYDVNNQPNIQKSKNLLLKRSHNGMICLLHAVSKTNASMMDSLIKDWKKQGYEFKTLNELP